ncbi:MAG: DUF882 domain-containing protein [Bacteroidota bacterium]
MLNRRKFLKFSLGMGAGLAATPALARVAPRVELPPATGERVLSFYNTHTGEHTRATYWADGEYVTSELTALDRLLRDFRNGEVAVIDRRLFDILYNLQQLTAASGTFQVISGYRSPATNAQLRAHSSGVARNSLHMRGQAIDIRLTGVELRDLHRAALALRAGGVGYYPSSDFVHVDTGRVRAW